MGHETISSPARTKSLIATAVAAVALGALPTAAFAEIELGEGFSVSGFVDMSIFYNDTDGQPSSTSSGVDQVETDFMYAGSNGVSAQVDIEYGERRPPDTFVEQAFITKKFNDQCSIKAGRFLSYSGWETEEPTGLFQYSGVGYAPYFYGYYQQGVSASYSGEKFAVMGSIVNDVFGCRRAIERDTDKPGIRARRGRHAGRRVDREAVLHRRTRRPTRRRDHQLLGFVLDDGLHLRGRIQRLATTPAGGTAMATC